MGLIWEVYKDLSQFAWQSVRRAWSAPEPTLSLIAPPVQKTLSTQTEDTVQTDDEGLENTFKSVKSVVAKRPATSVRTHQEPIPQVSRQEQIVNGPMVVATKARLYQRPTREFDAAVAVVPYGAAVTVRSEQGSWAQVVYRDLEGWIERDQLVSNQAMVRPFFVIKEYCAPDSEVTKRLRQMIDDEFQAGVAEVPLHAEEYVYYQLLVRGIFLPAIPKRPRQAGLWHRLFAGQRGVHVSVKPKTGSVMEYVDTTDSGHVAYVEAVFPDESISVSEVGHPEPGYFNERTLGKEVWQHLQPVFISFN